MNFSPETVPSSNPWNGSTRHRDFQECRSAYTDINPDLDEVPADAGDDIDLPEGKDLMVLDVLELLKEKDPILSYPSFLPRRRLRLGRDQYEWQQRPCLHDAGFRGGEARQADSATATGICRWSVIWWST